MSSDSPTKKPQYDKTVLIVDDNPANLLLAKLLTEGLGCEILTASNGEEAVETASTQSLDLIVMDIQMPVMDGYEATLKIRELDNGNQNIPVIAMTADMSSEESDFAAKNSMNGCLKKPVRESDFIVVFDRYFCFQDSVHESGEPQSVEANSSNQSLFDQERLSILRRDLEDDFCDLFIQMASHFINGCSGDLEELQEAISQKNTLLARKHVHKLKGGALNLGLSRFTFYCEGLQEIFHRDGELNVSECKEQMKGLLDQHQQLLNLKSNCFDKEPSSEELDKALGEN